MSDAELDWERIKELVADALEKAGAERSQFLAALDEHDPHTARVRELVAAADRAPELDAHALALPLADQDVDWTGQRIGGYRVQRFLARGGMGEVYEAVQDGTNRSVALKLLARDTRRDRSRFLREGRLLGQLAHPAIAQILDADVYRVADGVHLPYLALELVDGVPLTHYAERESLDRSQRLELFVELCRAVEHAHRKGIVHRDLKPDNVLVSRGDDGAGHPKVLDFGIAALIDEEPGDATRLTLEGDLIGTLAYMAPEQVSGARVDARTDVYALGVLLYELLLNRPPFELAGRSVSDSLRILERGGVPRASTHDTSLRGDLDTIVAAAMAREPERRYSSAGELADDIERHLAHRPIAARPASRVYRTLKFAQRNRLLVTSLVVAFTLLTLGIVGTSIGVLRARAEAAHGRDVNEFFASILATPSPANLGRDVTLRSVLDARAPEVDARFGDHPETAAQLHRSIGRAYFESGDLERGESHMRRAADYLAEALGPDAEGTLEVERLANNISNVRDPRGTDSLARSRSIAERAREALGRGALVTLEADGDVASVLAERGDLEDAIALYRATLEHAQQVSGSEGSDLRGTLMNGLAVALSDAGHMEEAGEVYRRRGQALEEELGARHPDVLLNRVNLAVNLGERGFHDESLAMLTELTEPMLEVLGEEHPDCLTFLSLRAATLSDVGEFAAASAEIERLLPLLEASMGPHHRDTLLALGNLAVIYLYQDRDALVEAPLRTVIERAETLGDAGREHLLTARSTLVSLLGRQERLEEAARVSQQVVDGASELRGESHPRTLIDRNNQARLLHRMGRAEEAATLLEVIVEDWRRTLPEEIDTLRTLRWNLARAQVDAGAYGEAEGVLNAIAAVDGAVGAPSQAELEQQFAKLYGSWEPPGALE